MTVRVGVRTGIFVGLIVASAVVLPLLLAFAVYQLPEAYPFTILNKGVTVAFMSAILLGVLSIAFWMIASKGKVVIDSRGMRWKIGDDRGEIRWDAPFSVRRWRSVFETGGYSYHEQGVAMPVIVYEITQGNTRFTFWHSERVKDLEHLPSGPLAGYPVSIGAGKLRRAIDSLR